MNEEEIKEYLLSSEYYGVFKWQYETYVPLKYHELHSFLEQAGIHGDLEVIRVEDRVTLFDTFGPYVHQILPELPLSDRELLREDINRFATVINQDFLKNQEPEKLQKIEEFIQEYQELEAQYQKEMEMI